MADMASELEAIAFRLRRAGQDDLARELTAAMKRGVKPVPDKIRDGLKPKLPDRYAEVLDDDLDIKIIARNSGGVDANAVVSVYGKTRSGKRRRFKRLEGGVLEHPFWGDRSRWDKQSVQPDWFSGPAETAAPQVRAELQQALRDVSDKATGK